ncbi:MAG: DnaA regulatory inactivator Hda [Methylococcales bacterium]|nr:DnaA regulatory inactivator Hda [Methylococcales bacterium]
MPKQLPLQFEFQANQNFSTFYPGSNEEAVNHLQKIFTSTEQQIFLWGETGTGKTHLLQATSQIADKINKTAFYFSFATEELPNPSMLDGLDKLDLVCFDNIDLIAGNSEWERAFFNFFNRHRDGNKKLLLSASCQPKYLAIQLPDLKTRMNWGLTLKLNTLTNEQQLDALIYKANDLGFEIPVNVGRFLMTHYASDLPTIWKLIDKIDQATLAAKRKLTIPFLKQIMADKKNHDD